MKPYELFILLLKTTTKKQFIELLRQHRDDRGKN